MSSVKFSDVVKRVNVYVDRHNTDIQYYVGGEHMDSSAFKVSGRGFIKGSTIGYKFHFGFQPGHILFGSRNPHLRKCSMVDFPGICSDSTYVVETRDPNVLDQRYLLIEMQSDRFWDWAEENKSGSVNYLINYCTLDEYEFDLPPIERQRELADLLWAANDLKEAYKKAITATDEMLKAKFREMFGEGGNEEKRLGELLTIERGGSPRPISKFLTDDPNGINWIKIGDVTTDDKYITRTAEKIIPTGEKMSRRVYPGDFLLSNSMSFGRPYILKIGGCIHDGWLVLRDTNNIFNSEYLYYLLGSDDAKNFFASQASGSTVKNLNKDLVGAYVVAVPPLAKQQEFVEIAQKADVAKASLKKSIDAIDRVMKGLING